MSTTTAAYWINAVRDGDLEKVKALLDNGMDVNYIMDEDNVSDDVCNALLFNFQIVLLQLSYTSRACHFSIY